MQLISCFNEKIGRVKKKGLLLQLFADKTKKIEQELQLLKFPGGLIEIARCTNGDHWAHIAIHDRQVCEDLVVESANRYIESVSINSSPVTLDFPDAVNHIALRIAPQSLTVSAGLFANGWGIAFPGGYIVLEEAGSGLLFRVHVTSSVTETRIDNAYPHGITELPTRSIECLEVRLSRPH